MRFATATVLSGIVLLFGAVLGVSPTVSFGAGMAALVAGAFALAIALEDRERQDLPSPVLARMQRGLEQ
jgi:hypothetical protein